MRKSMRSGFTLIELMVVVVLVMILALAIVPTFKEVITKSKYTEGSSAISALRTKIKVFYVENNRLPGVPADIADNEYVKGGMSWGNTARIQAVDAAAVSGSEYDVATVSALNAADHIVQRLASQTAEEEWLFNSTINYYSPLAYVAGDPDYSYFQSDLDIEVGDYAGAYFKNDDYQYVAFNAGMRVSSYGYAVLVAGSGNKKSPPVGTGYGVMEIRNTGWTDNQLLTLTFERYKAKSGRASAAESLPLVLFPNLAGAVEQADYVGFPLWYEVDVNQASTSSSDGYFTISETVSGRAVLRPDVAEFDACGWSAQ